MTQTAHHTFRSRGLAGALSARFLLGLGLLAVALGCSRAAPDADVESAPPGRPRAVVPASAGVLDIVAALLPPEAIAGLPEQALVYSGLRDPRSPYLQRPRFERYAAESVLALAPDLVIAQTWSNGETTSRLREAGVRVELLGAANSWEAVRAQILEVGTWLDREAEAQQLVAGYDLRVAALAALPPLPDNSALVYNHLGGQGRVAGGDTTSDAMLRLAGLRNLVAEAGMLGHHNFDFEQLLDADPVFLVVGSGGDGDFGATAGVLANDARLAELRAVRDGGVLLLEPWLNVTTSQYMIEAAEVLRERAETAVETAAEAGR